MIVKLGYGSGFSGVIRYVEQKGGSEFVDSNLAAATTNGRAAEMREIAATRPDIEQPVLHVSLSLAPGEHLSDEQWRQVGQDWLREFGGADAPDRYQWTLTQHTDRPHDHAHLIVNRVPLDGGRVLQKRNDYRRAEVAARAVERQHGLSSPERGRRTDQGRGAELRQTIDQAIRDSGGDRDRFGRLLAERGIRVEWCQQSTGRIYGCAFHDERNDGHRWRGGSLGRGYTSGSILRRLDRERGRRERYGHGRSPGPGGHGGSGRRGPTHRRQRRRPAKQIRKPHIPRLSAPGLRIGRVPGLNLPGGGLPGTGALGAAAGMIQRAARAVVNTSNKERGDDHECER